jgi:hypothetical protein
VKRLRDWFRGNNVIEVVEANFKTGEITFRSPRWQLKPIFAWYDFWVGVYVDREKRRVYVFPIPCFGFVFFWG